MRSDITPLKVNRFGRNLDLSEYVVWGWPWQILSAIRTVTRTEEQYEVFFVFFLSGKQRTILPISRRRNFTKFEHNTSIDEAMNPFGTEFWKIFRKRSFSKKTQKIDFFQRLVTSGRHNSAVITFTNRRKFITKEPSTRCLVSIFTVGINWKWFPWPVHSAQETSPKSFLRRRTRLHGMPWHNYDGLSGRGPMTSLGEGKDGSFNKITVSNRCDNLLRLDTLLLRACARA